MAFLIASGYSKVIRAFDSRSEGFARSPRRSTLGTGRKYRQLNSLPLIFGLSRRSVAGPVAR